MHEHPDEEKLNSLKRLIAIMGLDLSIPKDPEPKDIQKLLETVKGEDIEPVVQVMTLRSLPQACYSTENAGHFGIASECYTHFTSPIRRYPDLMVHRLIRQAISDGLSKAELKKQTEFLLRAADHCSETEQNATDTERDVDDLKMTEYMVPFVGEPFDAHVTGITRFGVFVGLDNGVEGLVHIDSMDDDEYIYQEDTMTLKGRFSGTTYSMGMPVRVTLVKADKERREVDFIMGEIHSPLNLEKKTRSSARSKSHSKKKMKKGKK
ncbi:ribonuclease R [Bacteroides xylanisolvens]|nr:ribonuclease R [Bacteroides xylanisolvens]